MLYPLLVLRHFKMIDKNRHVKKYAPLQPSYFRKLLIMIGR